MFYVDKAGKRRWTAGAVEIAEVPLPGGFSIRTVLVHRKGGTTAIPEWRLAPESRHLLEQTK